MPEGHSIHRYARLHRGTFAGRSLAVSSPQGRFAAGAADLDGRVLHDVAAAGKHLFYRWDGDRVLHVHLGLFGRFRTHHGDPPPPSEGTRLAMWSNDAAVYLSGPTRCALIDPAAETAVRARLGPDPLAVGRSGLASFQANLRRRRIAIGAALLNQQVIAGVGNVYRAEALFLARLHPDVPSRDVPTRQVAEMWSLLVDLLRRGEQRGVIVTVDPAELGAAAIGELDRHERLFVYQRSGLPCRRCGVPIVRWELAGRSIWACPGCQPPR